MKLALLSLLALPAAAQQYSIATVAGGANPATPVPATSISIGQPRRITLDSQGNVYFSAGNSVFKISGSTLTLDRALRNIVIGLGSRLDGVPRQQRLHRRYH